MWLAAFYWHWGWLQRETQDFKAFCWHWHWAHRRHFAHRKGDVNSLQSPWCEDGIRSIQGMHGNMGVIDDFKTWRLFCRQWTWLFHRLKCESSPKDGKVLPSVGMTLSPAPMGAFTIQLSGHVGHEDYEDIAHAHTFRAWPCSWCWGSWTQLCLLMVWESNRSSARTIVNMLEWLTHGVLENTYITLIVV